MSQALKCDRCKVCFDPWTTEGEFATIREMTFQNRENWKNHDVSYRDEEFHMCPQCAEEFSQEFLGNRRLFSKQEAKTRNSEPQKFRFLPLIDPLADEKLNDHMNRIVDEIIRIRADKKEEK